MALVAVVPLVLGCAALGLQGWDVLSTIIFVSDDIGPRRHEFV